MSDYLVIYEHDATSWSAYVPDLPGCVAAATTQGEVEELMRSAMQMHVESLRAAGEPVPAPTTSAGTIAA
jgi:predicted RNase H-like HicB family nuclease